MPAAVSSHHHVGFDLCRPSIRSAWTSSADHLLHLRAPAVREQLVQPLKEEMQAVPLFRWCKSAVNGVRISDEDALADSTALSALKPLPLETPLVWNFLRVHTPSDVAVEKLWTTAVSGTLILH